MQLEQKAPKDSARNGNAPSSAQAPAQTADAESEQSHGTGSEQSSAKPAVGENAARAEGRSACQGMTPLEAARHFKAGARRAGVTKRFAELVTEPTPEVEASSGYPRLVGALYATTVPEKGRAEAAAGCAEELAADGEGGGVSSERTGQTASPSQGGAQQKGSN